MNKNMKIVAALMAVGLVSPMAYATNGDTMMSVGSQNTALGGTGVANFTGAESTFANPAMLGKSKGAEVVGGVVLFQPKVTNTGFNPAAAGPTSTADTNYIPDISFSSRISDSLTYGVAMAGIAGMGVNYMDANPQTHILAKTALSILKVVPTIAYNQKDYGVGFSPILQYGSLMVRYNNYNPTGGPGGTPAGANYNPDQNASTDTAYGYTLGGYFNVMPTLTVAASYQSEIAMKYGTQLSGAGAGFGLSSGSPYGAGFGDTLTQPAEMKAGVAYNMSSVTLTADYKLIQWSSAAGYKDFNWKDQTVVAVGAKYAGNGYWLGLGYNHSDDPIGELPATGANAYRNSAVNFFNNMMFPGIVKDSFTLGGGYSMTKALDLEASAVISPEVKKTVDVSGLPGGTTNTTTHSQQSYSLSLRYKF
jgi:long-chain fatty acid transport protein